MWFDKQSYLQTFAKDFHTLLTDNGWGKAGEYRIKQGNTKFIEVKLYESLGSDNDLRKFGTAIAYDTADSDFQDNRFIAPTSPLGLLGTSDGTKTVFYLKVAPVVASSLVIYADGVVVTPGGYTVDAATGKITFSTAPQVNVRLTYQVQLSTIAHEPSNELIVFTYDRFAIEKTVKAPDLAANLGNGNGTKTVFNLGNGNIDETRLKVMKGSTVVPLSEYTIDAVAGTITFLTAPSSAETINVEYVYYVSPNGSKVYADLTASATFDPQSIEEVMAQVYTTGAFTNPSPPLSLAFNPDKRLTNEWQRDSTVYFYGNINKDRIIMFLRIDPTGNPISAYFVPFYFGKINTLGLKPRKNVAFFGGTRTGDDFKWAKDKKIGPSVVDYGVETANGNTVASLSQSYSGAMYQQHYFAFITHDKEVDNGQGRYNPSMYSDKYHLSSIYLVHPNDGHVGRLDDIYAVHPKNIQQADELEITKLVKDEVVGTGDGSQRIFHLEHKPKNNTTLSLKVNCVAVPTGDYTFDPETKQIKFNNPPVGEILANYEFAQLYRYTLPTTPVSPCTQDKATPFNPIGLAVYKEEL